MSPPRIEDILKSTQVPLTPCLDLTELEPLEGTDRMYFCRKDFGSSRIITKKIEKLAELRKLNNFLSLEQNNLDAVQLQRLNEYKSQV